MRAEDLDYDLPEAAIAQVPVEPRHDARLLVDQPPGPPLHRRVRDLPELLEPGDLVVVNDTRVRAARLRVHKRTGGVAEVLLLEPAGVAGEWYALVRPGRRLPPGTELVHAGVPVVRVGDVAGDDGRRLVRILDDEAAAAAASVPLPPYIHRPLADPERYQTVFARREASVAAPTAGLHLTEELLDRMERASIGLARIELEVGLGTFRPVTADDLDDHVMHRERYRVDPATWERILQAPRVVAVGTTVVRTLETAAATDQLEGASDLFIRPGFRWQLVDRLLTNFHVPRSTLLALVEAFVGPRWRALYAEALGEGYRFLSFGDAMLLSRQDEVR